MNEITDCIGEQAVSRSVVNDALMRLAATWDADAGPSAIKALTRALLAAHGGDHDDALAAISECQGSLHGTVATELSNVSTLATA